MEDINIDELAQWIVDCWEYYHRKPRIFLGGVQYEITGAYTYIFQ